MTLPCFPDDLWKYGLGLSLYALLEFWLGRTKRTEAASVIELVLMVGAAFLFALAVIFSWRKK